MTDSLLQTIIRVLGGGVAGFLIAIYTTNQKKKKKKIAYETNEIKLLEIHDDTPDAIDVSVDKSVITGIDSDKGEKIQIKSAVAQSLSLKNKGNSLAEDIYIDIIFSESEKILSVSSSPSSSEAYKLKFTKHSSKPNILKVYIPYLNEKGKVVIYIITTGTNDNKKHSVKIIGQAKDTEIYKFTGAGIINLVIPFLLFLLFAFSLTLFFEQSSSTEMLSAYLPEDFLLLLGGKREIINVEITTFNNFVRNIVLTIEGFLLLLTGARFLYKNEF